MDREKKDMLIAYLIAIVPYISFLLLVFLVWQLNMTSIEISGFLVCLTGIFGGMISPYSYKKVWIHFSLTILIYIPIAVFILGIFFLEIFSNFYLFFIMLLYATLINVCISLGFYLCLIIGSIFGKKIIDKKNEDILIKK